MVMVSICKSIDVETDVNVDVDEITCALRERLQSVEEQFQNDNEYVRDAGRTREILGFMNSTGQCLQAVTDKMIASLEPKHRKILFDALVVQTNRWSETYNEMQASATLSESSNEVKP